ncbi:MAG: ABC transporter ATP-binding protein [Candidatus Kerfeldbacteria bacterium]|nr:ABC transporter ATP-binding protein [Candidatus Kerfeldbacteria bacterium]
MEPIISIAGLNVTYSLGHKQEVRALQDITLKIYPGEFIIFFGPSGCGKSTLLYSIAGLETHAQGPITVGGQDVHSMDAHATARFRQLQIGMIFQAFYLIPSLTVEKNILLPQMAVGGAPTDRSKRARELMDHFGVASQAGKLPTELSGGQQQRVAICRALMNNPDILLADEPVGNLDSKSSNDVIGLIRELNVQQKKTVILVTHDPSHLHLAHRVFHMKDGRITQVKVNSAVTPAVQTDVPSVQLPKDLELLIRTFTSLTPEGLGSMLIPYKAKEIVAEILTGFSVEEVARIEREIQHALMAKLSTGQELSTFLDQPTEQGGMGLDRRTAARLAERMERVVAEIRALHDEDRLARADQASPAPHEAVELRQFLFATYQVTIKDDAALHQFDRIILDRLDNRIDSDECFRRIDAARRDGGVGLDRRTARKLTRHLDLILLGKYEAS